MKSVLHQPDNNSIVSVTEHTKPMDFYSLNSINIRHSKQHLEIRILDFYHKRWIHLEIGNGNEKQRYIHALKITGMIIALQREKKP